MRHTSGGYSFLLIDTVSTTYRTSTFRFPLAALTNYPNSSSPSLPYPSFSFSPSFASFPSSPSPASGSS